MYVLTNNENVIIEISSKYEVNQEVRNIYVKNRDNFEYAIAYAPDEVINCYEVSNVTDSVVPAKYCYTEDDRFYVNPNYVEPPKPIEERVTLAEDSITEIEIALTEIYEGGLI